MSFALEWKYFQISTGEYQKETTVFENWNLRRFWFDRQMTVFECKEGVKGETELNRENGLGLESEKMGGGLSGLETIQTSEYPVIM